MRTVSAAISALCFCLGAACAPVKNNSTDSVTSSAEHGIPIVGSWIAESYNGYSYEIGGERKPVFAGVDQLRVSDWQLETRIDSKGTGYLKTKIDCEKPVRSGTGFSSGIPVPRSFTVFPDALQLRTCDKGQPVRHHQTHTLQALQQRSIPRNLGIHGVEKPVSELCSELRGSRYVRQETSFLRNAGSTGCIGFTDAGAQKMAMIVVPDGELYALRINFKRIK
ncbi:MAG: hypothetical protein EBR09_15530 [Proteobacteria bacterium]|nr:hypothetical protein [Pseudomonadota bacterium]